MAVFVYVRDRSHPVPTGLPLDGRGMELVTRLASLPADDPDSRLLREKIMKERGLVQNPRSGIWEMPAEPVVAR